MKVYNLCRVSNYSNSRVRGYGQLEWPYCSPVRCFQNDLWNELRLWLDHNRVVTWVTRSHLGVIKLWLALELSRDKSGFCKTTLELSVLLQKPLHLLVLVCEYLKSTHGFVPGYSRGQTMKRSTWRMDPRKVTTTRIISHRQHCLWPRRWSFAYATVIITYSAAWSCIKNWIMRSLFGKNLCMVCNGWCTMVSNSVMSRKNGNPGIAMYGITGIWD